VVVVVNWVASVGEWQALV